MHGNIVCVCCAAETRNRKCTCISLHSACAQRLTQTRRIDANACIHIFKPQHMRARTRNLALTIIMPKRDAHEYWRHACMRACAHHGASYLSYNADTQLHTHTPHSTH